jgi:hypothetical protein
MAISPLDMKFVNKKGNPENIHQELMKFRKDVLLLAQQRTSLTKKHPNMWIAFYNGEVVYVAKTLDDLLTEIDKMKLPRDMVITQFLSTEKIAMIL